MEIIFGQASVKDTLNQKWFGIIVGMRGGKGKNFPSVIMAFLYTSIPEINFL
jgi:hypothetical protein